MRPSAYSIHLDPKQQEALQKILRSGKAEVRLQFRASIIWQLAVEQKKEAQVAEELKTSTKTVRKWRNRFIQSGIEGLHDLPRSGAPTKFSISQRCEVIAIACDEPKSYGYPEYTHWNLDILTQAIN